MKKDIEIEDVGFSVQLFSKIGIMNSLALFPFIFPFIFLFFLFFICFKKMTQNSFNSPEKKNLFQTYILNPLFLLFNRIVKANQEFNEQFPATSQIIQLTFVYFFALIDLTHSILGNVYSLGPLPTVLGPFIPFFKLLLTHPFFQIFASQEKVFLLSFLVIEFMVVRKTGFSKLVKYNVLLIFSLLMVQQLVISYWDLLFHRSVAESASEWAYEGNPFIFNDSGMAYTMFFNTFLVFVAIYLYLYSRAIKGRFATLPFLTVITDSVAFWLRIKTPTMRFGQFGRGKKKGKK
jgi:hypothetical protein